MKTLIVQLFVVLLFVSVSSCNLKSARNAEKIDAETYEKHIQKGDKISSLAQGVLLANVGKAIQQGGTEYAVEFCNLRASSLIDSLNQANNVFISRISDKNRNPENNVKNEVENQLWTTVAEQLESGMAGDTLIRLNNKLIYYKPIKTAMPACLKCHGNPETDIELSTLSKLQTLYPKDRATGYQLNDFRGLWKIEFSE